MTSFFIQEHALPDIAAGMSRKVTSYHFQPPSAKKKVYIQAGLHADEAPGYLVAARLLELLHEAQAADLIREEIIIVPVANPIGLSQWGVDTIQGRFDATDHVNFNRKYYDPVPELRLRLQGTLSGDDQENIKIIRSCFGQLLSEKQPVTEAETLKHILLTLSHDADIVLDLHCDAEAMLHVYMGTGLWPKNRDLSAQLGAQVTLLADDSGDLPFDEANSKIWWELARIFPEANIPKACMAATVELRGVADTSPDFTEQDATNLIIYLQRCGYLSGNTPELPALLAEATPLEGVEYLAAPCAGIIAYCKPLGDAVNDGDTVAFITRSLAKQGRGEKVPIITKTAGFFFARAADRFARPGKIIGKVAGAIPLPGKGPNLLTA